MESTFAIDHSSSTNQDGTQEPFALDPNFVAQFAGKDPAWGYGVLSYVVYKRTYARELNDGSGNTEEFWQTCERVVNGTFELQRRLVPHAWDAVKAQAQAQRMYRYMWEFKFLPPGRGLWSMGAPIVMERGNAAALMNCAFRSTKDIALDFALPFRFLLEASAVGVGVGFDTRGEGKIVIQNPEPDVSPIPGTSDNHWHTHVIDDSREGWSVALGLALNAYVGRGKLPRFDYSEVRPFGSPIKTFGGTASGPGALRELLEQDIPDILNTPGQPICSGQIVDLMNAIGKCVVAGGARRSAEIAIGRHDDEAFIALKTDQDKLMRWRWASNNSILTPTNLGVAAYTRYANLIMGEPGGEPGFVWIENCRTIGRFKDGWRGDDFGILGMNPCSEIGLDDGELCNVVEVFITNCVDLEEFLDVLAMAHMYAKTVSLLPTPWPITNTVISRNRRIGVSLSGIVQNIAKRGETLHFAWCDAGYNVLSEIDRTLSKAWRVCRSIRLTTVKPSGTVSLLVGATPGIHFPHAEFIIRRVNFPKGSPILAALEAAGYYAEDNCYEATSTEGAKSRVVSFPIREANFSRAKADVPMEEQLELVARHQEMWADNAVSVTVTVQAHEAARLPFALVEYQHRLKTVSFLPLRDHKYRQAPYEEISESAYTEMVGNLSPLQALTSATMAGSTHEVTERFCDGESCVWNPKSSNPPPEPQQHGQGM